VLVSDAGAPFKIEEEVRSDWLSQARASLDVATDQCRALRKRVLIADYKASEREDAYWGIDTNISNYPLPDPMTCQADLVEPLPVIRTRLNPFSDEEQGRLMNWGYAVCDAALRSHASGLAANATRPDKWPVPSQALGTF
jgi:NTE family protein